MNNFEQVKKLAKNIQIFKDVLRRAPSQYKNNINPDVDENKMTRKQFEEVLDLISHEAQITPPTKQQKYQIICQFNPNKDPSISKDQYQKFMERIIQMLAATQNV